MPTHTGINPPGMAAETQSDWFLGRWGDAGRDASFLRQRPEFPGAVGCVRRQRHRFDEPAGNPTDPGRLPIPPQMRG